MHSPRDNINTNLTVSIRKNVNNALKDLWIIEEPTDIVESINALEGEVRKELGDVTGLLAVLFVLGSPAHGDEWLNECDNAERAVALVAVGSVYLGGPARYSG